MTHGPPQRAFIEELACGLRKDSFFMEKCFFAKYILPNAVFCAEFEYAIYFVLKARYNYESYHIRVPFSHGVMWFCHLYRKKSVFLDCIVNSKDTQGIILKAWFR
jgi:hypothetical protein